MAALVAIGAEVVLVVLGRAGDEWYSFHDLEAVALQAYQLPGVVGHDPDGGEPQIPQDLTADTVVPEIRREAEPLVGLHGIVARVLGRIRADLVEQAYASAFLVEIDDDTATLPPHQVHGSV